MYTGVQLCTSNYVDGVSLELKHCKDITIYRQRQGMRLETVGPLIFDGSRCIRFLERCASTLVSGGYICIKRTLTLTKELCAGCTRRTGHAVSVVFKKVNSESRTTGSSCEGLEANISLDINPVPMLAFE